MISDINLAKEQLKTDKMFLQTLSSALEHYALMMSHDPVIQELGEGCHDPLRADLLRHEVFRRLEALEQEEKNHPYFWQ